MTYQKADIELQPRSSINDVFERLAHGDVPSRGVLVFEPSAAGARAETRKLEWTH